MSFGCVCVLFAICLRCGLFVSLLAGLLFVVLVDLFEMGLLFGYLFCCVTVHSC